ncbi:WGR domain-containing protein [Aminobacter sp. AP02]|uniref:WGR domain-containing protein n=1 Tax=Aminobacter sp. AP02 TaxID=2135737 RepID=UPI000D6AA335|nr:WGR domain-containing protein [Aminobacter sp. AP02]
MSKQDDNDLHLHRIDAGKNMRRYYGLTVQPTLFGGASLVRRWGRIGTSGQSMMQSFDRSEQADVELRRIEGAKRRRGYVDASGGQRKKWPQPTPPGHFFTLDPD